MSRSFVAAVLVLVASAWCADAAAQTTLYRWVDKDGKVHFTDTPPPSDAKAAEQRRFGETPPDQPLPYATQTAMRKSPVMLWVVPNCEPCAQGRQLLADRGIPFSERDAQANMATQEAFKKITGGDLNVPLLEVGSARVRGFEEGQWHAALDSAGYPKERPYGLAPTQPKIANLPSAAAPGKEAAKPQ